MTNFYHGGCDLTHRPGPGFASGSGWLSLRPEDHLVEGRSLPGRRDRGSAFAGRLTQPAILLDSHCGIG